MGDLIVNVRAEWMIQNSGLANYLRRLELSRRDQMFVGSLLLFGIVWIGFQTVGQRDMMVDLDEVPIHQERLMIRVNDAAWPEFVVLPGIGRTLAARIVEHRHDTGPYRAVEDWLAVHGIGPKIGEQLRPYLVFDGDGACPDN